MRDFLVLIGLLSVLSCQKSSGFQAAKVNAIQKFHKIEALSERAKDARLLVSVLALNYSRNVPKSIEASCMSRIKWVDPISSQRYKTVIQDLTNMDYRDFILYLLGRQDSYDYIQGTLIAAITAAGDALAQATAYQELALDNLSDARKLDTPAARLLYDAAATYKEKVKTEFETTLDTSAHICDTFTDAPEACREEIQRRALAVASNPTWASILFNCTTPRFRTYSLTRGSSRFASRQSR